ncbi:MAG: SRPBCC domain-containing protein [Actinomycetota bacterium]|nr:SRPBCC domain-containing protein [Actinomycetota bacterium]
MTQSSVSGSPQDPVVIEVTVAAPIQTVWNYLREPDLIRNWHGWLAEELDSEIDFIYRRHARETDIPYVLDIDRGSDDGPDGGWVEGGDRFELHESERGTTIRITRGPRGSGEMWDAWYDDITEGWTSFLGQLRFALEKHPDAARRTALLNVDGNGLRSVREALGLSAVAVGEFYVADSGSGLDLRGEGWFVAQHQLGVTVDSLGPGLVIAADKPDLNGVSKGAMVIVTTYGQDEQDFARTVRQWADWWRATYPGAQDPQT